MHLKVDIYFYLTHKLQLWKYNNVKWVMFPSNRTTSLFFQFYPPPPPPPHLLSVLHWQRERMLNPHKSQSLLVLQEQDSRHREAPAHVQDRRRADREETARMKVWERQTDKQINKLAQTTQMHLFYLENWLGANTANVWCILKSIKFLTYF